MKIIIFNLITILSLLISGCDAGNGSTTAIIPLKWQAPYQRVNGEIIESDELLHYEIWAGTDPDLLSLIYIYNSPDDADNAEIQVNLASILSDDQAAVNASLFVGVIAIDGNNKRSIMSELKELQVNF